MIICWDNLEKIKYSKKTGKWYSLSGTDTYKEKICKNCNDYYLTCSNKKSKFCSNKCTAEYRVKNKINSIPSGIKDGYYCENIPLYDTCAHQISFCEEIRRNDKDLNILEVKCAYCGKWFVPKLSVIYNRISALNGNSTKGAEHRLYCSTKCKQECPIYRQVKYPKGFKHATSREVQPELRQMCFERDGWICQKCGSTKSLHCHHIEGIHYEPLESADIDKVITLCKNCHKEVHKQPDCGYQDMRCK